jgi:hypothetical protein
MASRVLILGDSHLAALRQSLADAASDKALSFTVIAKGSSGDSHLGHIACMGDTCGATDPAVEIRIRAATGKDRFAPSDYAAIVLVGLRLELPYALWDAMAGGKARKPQHVSAACYQAALEGAIAQQSIAHPLVRQLRAATSAPILVVPNPYLSENMGLRQLSTAPGITPAGQFGIAAVMDPDVRLRDWQQAMIRLFAEVGATVLFQPPPTVAGGFCTASSFQGRDFRHMNETFGAIVLSQILQALRPAA